MILDVDQKRNGHGVEDPAKSDASLPAWIVRRGASDSIEETSWSLEDDDLILGLVLRCPGPLPLGVFRVLGVGLIGRLLHKSPF